MPFTKSLQVSLDTPDNVEIMVLWPGMLERMASQMLRSFYEGCPEASVEHSSCVIISPPQRATSVNCVRGWYFKLRAETLIWDQLMEIVGTMCQEYQLDLQLYDSRLRG